MLEKKIQLIKALRSREATSCSGPSFLTKQTQAEVAGLCKLRAAIGSPTLGSTASTQSG